MAEAFAWSYKRLPAGTIFLRKFLIVLEINIDLIACRKYKTGYVWQDLLNDDLITPISDNEYVLKGSQLTALPSGKTLRVHSHLASFATN